MITLPKIKLIQILINLIQNAKDAMIDSPSNQRNLTISIDSNDVAFFIMVMDTGSGIIVEKAKQKDCEQYS